MATSNIGKRYIVQIEDNANHLGEEAIDMLVELGWDYNVLSHFIGIGKNKFIAITPQDLVFHLGTSLGTQAGLLITCQPPEEPTITVNVFGMDPEWLDSLVGDKLAKHFDELVDVQRGKFKRYKTTENGIRHFKFRGDHGTMPRELKFKGEIVRMRYPGEPVRSRLCLKCGTDGHVARDCPKNATAAGPPPPRSKTDNINWNFPKHKGNKTPGSPRSQKLLNFGAYLPQGKDENIVRDHTHIGPSNTPPFTAEELYMDRSTHFPQIAGNVINPGKIPDHPQNTITKSKPSETHIHQSLTGEESGMDTNSISDSDPGSESLYIDEDGEQVDSTDTSYQPSKEGLPLPPTTKPKKRGLSTKTSRLRAASNSQTHQTSNREHFLRNTPSRGSRASGEKVRQDSFGSNKGKRPLEGSPKDPKQVKLTTTSNQA